MTGDVDPYYDTCSDGNHSTTGELGVMIRPDIGDLFNQQATSPGAGSRGLRGRLDPTPPARSAVRPLPNIRGRPQLRVPPHHNPVPSTTRPRRNPDHKAPTSLSEIGYKTRPGRTTSTICPLFNDALHGNVAPSCPPCSYLKAAESQDGHPAYSDPLDERKFHRQPGHAIEESPSTGRRPRSVTPTTTPDGWYDHQADDSSTGRTTRRLDTSICTSVAVTVRQHQRPARATASGPAVSW